MINEENNEQRTTNNRGVFGGLKGYLGSYVLAFYDFFEVAFFHEFEDDDGEFVVSALGDGGGVHDFEVFFEDFVEGDLGVFLGFGIFPWVGVVDPVDVGGFYEDFAVEFEGSKAGGGVGGEVGVAGAGGADDDAFFF